MNGYIDICALEIWLEDTRMFYKVSSESDVSTWSFVHKNLLEEIIYTQMQKRKDKEKGKGKYILIPATN